MRRDVEPTPLGVDAGARDRLWRQGSQRLVDAVAASFLARTPERLEQARRAIELDDAAGLAAVAHDLRPSCQMVGATHMAELVTRLEVEAERAERDELLGILEQAAEAFHSVRAWVHAFSEGDR